MKKFMTGSRFKRLPVAFVVVCEKTYVKYGF